LKNLGIDVAKAVVARFTIQSVWQSLGMAMVIFLCLCSYPAMASGAENPSVMVPLQAPEELARQGKQVFTNTCSACHIGGTNVIVPQKTLTQEALEKYAMNSMDAIKTQVTKGRNAMPAFGKRLSPEQIDAVSTYILEQADAGW
jgi:cytochrome c6